jgi:hypothetical protein
LGKGGPMSPEAREHSFDELAKGLASGTVSRRKALRLMGGALLGAALAAVPRAAWAQTPTPAGNSDCAELCHQIFPPGSPEAGECTSQGAQGRGPCHTCCPDAVAHTSGTPLQNESCMSTECSGCCPGSSCVTLVNCVGGNPNCGVCCPEGQFPCYIQQPDGRNLFTNRCCPTLAGGEFGCDRATGTCLQA